MPPTLEASALTTRPLVMFQAGRGEKRVNREIRRPTEKSVNYCIKLKADLYSSCGGAVLTIAWSHISGDRGDRQLLPSLPPPSPSLHHPPFNSNLTPLSDKMVLETGKEKKLLCVCMRACVRARESVCVCVCMCVYVCLHMCFVCVSRHSPQLHAKFGYGGCDAPV